MIKIIDKYILKQFIITFIFCLFALCIIFLVVNLLESLDDFLDKKASFEIVYKYYLYFLPEIIKLLTPVATLLSTLFTVGKLSTMNEIIAMKSGGFSLYRLMQPLIIFSILLSIGQLYFSGWIVPKANGKKFQIENQYLHRNVTGGPIHNLYIRDNPYRNLLMQYYDSDTKTGYTVAVEEYSSERSPRLLKRIEARTIVWDSVHSKWNLISGLIRAYSGTDVIVNSFDSTLIDINITHSQINKFQQLPDEMTYPERWDYIQLLYKGGKDVRQKLIEYHGNFAFPFANFIVILFGVPFASIRKKGGIAIQIGAALIISFVYLVFSKVSQTIGYATDLNPIFSGWMANIVFLMFGLIVLFRTKS